MRHPGRGADRMDVWQHPPSVAPNQASASPMEVSLPTRPRRTIARSKSQATIYVPHMVGSFVVNNIVRLLLRHVRAASAASVFLLLIPSLSFAQAGPFDGLRGSWAGGGIISLSDGSTERVRCKASYAVAGSGSELRQSLRCASDSYRFDLSSNVVSAGGVVSGTWSESTRNINGILQGHAGRNRITVYVEATGFAANLALTTNGNRQSVSISSKGEIRNVSINMIRG